MYKVTPAIMRFDKDDWGYYAYSELVECVNNLRSRLHCFKPLTAEEVFFNFLGMNTYGGPKFNELKVRRCWKTTGAENTDTFWSEETKMPFLPEDGWTEWEFYVPAAWGNRVLEAVRQGGVRAERITSRFGKRMQSRVQCFYGPHKRTEIVM